MAAKHRDRFEIARSNFLRAVTRLQDVLQVDESDIVRDSLIQRFEFSYELAWKCLFYWLRDQGETVPEMVRPVIQAAFRAGIIDDPQTWERIKDNRDETSHTYNEGKAVEVAAFVRAHAISAFESLADRLRTL